MTRFRSRPLLILLLVVAAALRLRGLDWDDHHHLHPDERFISMVEARLADPDGLRGYLRSQTSPLNPYNAGFSSFVYGTMPMLLGRYAGRAAGLTGYDGAYLAGRFLSALFDLCTVWLVYRIARRLTTRGWALAAAALFAGSPLAIQLSHFWTVDTFLTAFSAAALLAAVRLAQGRRDPATLLLGGLATGLAIACKVTGAALLAPLALGLLIDAARAPVSSPRERVRAFARAIAAGLAIVALAGAVTRLALPYAFASGNPFSFRLDPRWIDDLRRLSELTRSVASMPPSFQWAGRTIGYPLWNLAIYGCSPFFGLPALAGLVWGLAALRRRAAWAIAAAPLLLYVTLLFAWHGFALVKAMRYFHPTYPALAVLAALLLQRLAATTASSSCFFSSSSSSSSPQSPVWRGRRLVAAVCAAAGVAGTLVSGLAFSAIYTREHTRVQASRWIYANVRPPGIILNETWDDGQPMPMPGVDIAPYQGKQVEIVGFENPAKVEAIVDALTAVEGIAITSNRAYGSLTRIPDVFPVARAYYRALFDGRLGFRLVADIHSYPSLGPLRLPDDGAEEAFTVYDHPRVLLFRKSADFAPERVRAILSEALPQAVPTIHEWEKWPRGWRHTVDPIVPPRAHETPGVSQEPPAYASLSRAGQSSVAALARWYLAAALLGAIALPVAFVLLPRLADRGFGFARLIGLAIATYATRVPLWHGWMINGPWRPWIGIALLAAIAAPVLYRHRVELRRFLCAQRRALLLSEALFAAGFLLFTGLRALAPEIYWGEKPMDFSLLNTLLRSGGLPPADPWFAGAPFNYYFFGQEMIALLTQLTDLPSRFTFNLAFGLIGGALMQGAFSLASTWGRSRIAGLAGVGLTLLIGNLSGLREWLVRGRHLDWDYFWATSRVVDGTINEYPLWSLLFADLHAHVLAMPLFLLVLASLLQLVRACGDAGAGWRERLRSAALLGCAMGLQALTNAWDVPLLIGLAAAVAPVTILLQGKVSAASLGAAASVALTTAATALIVAGPMWPATAGRPGIGWDAGGAARGIDVLTVFGLFFFLTLAWWIVRAASRLPLPRRPPAAIVVTGGALLALALLALGLLRIDAFLLLGIVAFLAAMVWLARDADERLACGLVATAFFLVLLPQRVYIADRMNTFFKLYLEAWLLFAMAGAALVSGRRETPSLAGLAQAAGRPASWLLGGAALILTAAAAFTGISAAYGQSGRHFAAYSGPSLDGLRYLAEQRRDEYDAVQWIERHIARTPVILEAQGASYQDFSRISMFTGLPTVLGWEHHVKQRGNPPADVEARREAVRTIYTSTDIAAIEPLLRRHHVALVYDGWLERQTYPAEGLEKFRQAPHLFELIYENPGTRLYRVRGERADAASPVR